MKILHCTVFPFQQLPSATLSRVSCKGPDILYNSNKQLHMLQKNIYTTRIACVVFALIINNKFKKTLRREIRREKISINNKKKNWKGDTFS